MKPIGAEPILLFDGLCNLCNAAVQWLIVRDRRGLLRFASLQSEIGQQIQQQHGLDPAKLDSLVLYEDGQLFLKSDAVLRLADLLSWPYRLLRFFTWVPLFFRDGLYDWVARNRYRWFGKKEACMLPKAEWKDRFLR